VITGQRRSGKSTILRLLCEQYSSSYLLDMEDFDHSSITDAEDLHGFIKDFLSAREVQCFAIDEVQVIA
jgi:predicted AAA+ superfamily ATPase